MWPYLAMIERFDQRERKSVEVLDTVFVLVVLFVSLYHFFSVRSFQIVQVRFNILKIYFGSIFTLV